MANLTDLGFFKDAIVETIVSTYNVNGQPNAAPMGAIMKNEEHIIINLFNSSQTCKNLLSKKCAVVNITSDPELFYRTAFKEVNPEGTIPSESFEKAQTVNAPKLHDADATIEISVKTMSPITSEKTQATCCVKLIEATNVPPKAYSRALHATIEAIVHATRVKVFAKDKQKQEQVNDLLLIINNCRDIVYRTSPNSRYSGIMEDLAKRIDLWSSNK
jgi:uncharacterized protein